MTSEMFALYLYAEIRSIIWTYCL